MRSSFNIAATTAIAMAASMFVVLLLDMPVAESATGFVDVLIDVALSPIAPLVVVLFTMLITRGIAALCRPMSRREP